MEKRQQIIIVLAVVILILAAATFIIAKGSNFYNFSEQEAAPTETEPIEKTKIETLNVTYWNPGGGPRQGVNIDGMSMDECIDYQPLDLPDYITGSAIIVSATVTESIEWTNETEEGKAKLESFGSLWAYPHGKECYMTVNEVFKGNFEINQIYLKTDVDRPDFSAGEEYILFLEGPHIRDANYYWIKNPDGYLIKKGSNYDGMVQSISKSDLKKRIETSKL